LNKFYFLIKESAIFFGILIPDPPDAKSGCSEPTEPCGLIISIKLKLSIS